MKADEFMIGNFVNPEIPEKIVQVEEDCVLTESFLFLYGDDIQGIPLDLDWLELFGFKEKRGRWRVQRFDTPLVINEQSIYMRLSENNQLLLEYVHQLQNAYFVVNGSKLEIINQND